MGFRLLEITVKDGHEHFASSKEVITVERDEDPPPDMKLEKLFFLVCDAEGRLVYCEVWPGSKAEGANVKKNDSPGPPASFTWDGTNNQLPKAVDEKKGEHQRWATPLGSPYTLKLVAELSKGVELSTAPEDMSTDKVLPCQQDQVPKDSSEAVEEQRKAPLLASLQITCGGGSSKSFTPYEALAGKLPLLPDEKDRFHFAAGEETDAKIVWALEHQAEAKTTGGELALFASGKKRPIWKYTLDNTALKKNQLARSDWDRAKQSTTEFFEDLLAFKDAPYQLRLTLTGPEIKKGFEVAWTYVDVAIASFELLWGEASKLPTRKPPTDDAVFKDLALEEEVVLLRKLKGQADVEPDTKSLADLQLDDDGFGLEPVATTDVTLELRSNLFYQDMADWNDGKGATLYDRCWGDGPRLPIYAEIKVRDSSGKGVLAPKAVAGMQILWDWEDPCLDKEKGLETPDFLRWAFNRSSAANPDRRCDTDSPRSTNCHKDHGGKLGSGAKPVFPEQKGTGTFPFKVEACSFRKWAVRSTVYGGTDVAYKGKTGVVFQPSRIAGDNFRVRAYLYTDKRSDFKHDIHGEDLWAEATRVGLPRATTGAIEIWRRVDILRYYGKTGDQPQVDIDEVNKKFTGAKLKLYMPAQNDDKAVEKMWGQALQDILQPDAGKAGTAGKRVRLLAAEQVKNGYQLNPKTWSEWSGDGITWALDKMATAAPTATRIGSAKTGGASWWTVHDHLASTELDTLSTKLGEFAFANPDFGLPDGGNYSVVDNAVTIGGIAPLYSSGTLTGGWFVDSILGPLVGKYIKDPVSLTADDGAGNLKSKSGLHIFHFASPLPTRDDSKGAAFKLKPHLYGGVDADAGKQGMAYFSAKPPENRVEIHAHNKVDPLGGGGPDNIIPERLDVVFFPFYISSDLAEDSRFGDDLDGALATLVNASAFKILEKLGRKDVLPPAQKKRKDEPSDIAWERSLDLWHDYVQLRVKGGSQESVDIYTKRLRELREVTVQKLVSADLREKHVFVTHVAPLDQDRALDLKFGGISKDLSHKDGGARLDEKVLTWVRDLFRRTPRQLGSINVYHRGTKSSGGYADKVVQYLEALLRIVAGRVKINAGADIRPVANDHDSERDVFVSTTRPFDESSSTKVRFNRNETSVYKNKINEALTSFVTDAKGSSTQTLPPVYVYYKDTKDGRRRRAVVSNYLSALFETKYGLEDWALEPTYSLTPLAAHEMAHTLFLQHAPSLGGQDPSGAEDWCHVPGYDCLMNYDPGGEEFCGFCILQMRGWKVGSKAACTLKVTDGPAFTGPTTKPASGGGDGDGGSKKAPNNGPPPVPLGPDHTVGHVLEDAGLTLQASVDVNGYRVTTLQVYQQGGAQGGLNTCGFHSLKNAAYLQHYVKKIQTTNGTYRKGQAAAPLLDRIQVQPAAADRFNEVFLDGGTDIAPGAQSWLKAAQDKGNMPQGADKSIGAEHQEEILGKLRAGTCRLPADGGATLNGALADEIAVSLDFGQVGEFILYGGGEVPAAIKLLYEMQGPPPMTRSFTCGVGPHFIAVTANRYEPTEVELIVADSLNHSASTNERALRGLSAWIADTDRELAVATFKVAFFDDLEHRLPKHHDDLMQPSAGSLDAVQLGDFIRIFKQATDWLDTAGLRTNPKFNTYTTIMKGYLGRFKVRLTGLGNPGTLRQECTLLEARLP